MRSKFQRIPRQTFHAGFRHHVILFQANPRAQFRSVQPRLRCKNIADGKRVLPVRIEVWAFMGKQTDAMPEVMKKCLWAVSVQHLLRTMEQLLRAQTGTDRFLDHLQHIGNGLPGLLLFVVNRCADAHRTAIIGIVPPVPRSQVEHE